MKEEAGTRYVQVKFPREEVITTLEEGKQTVTVSGIVEKTSFCGHAEVNVFKPGNGNRNNENSGNNGHEGDNGDDVDHGSNGQGNRGN